MVTKINAAVANVAKPDNGNAAIEAMLAELKAKIASLETSNVALQAERDAAKAQAARKGNGRGRGRETLPEVLGHSATGIMRSLIALGCTGSEMNKTLAVGYQVFGSPSGMNTQISRVDKWLKVHGNPAATDADRKEVKGFGPVSLTREQVDALCKVAGISAPATLPDWCQATATPAVVTPTAPVTA